MSDEIVWAYRSQVTLEADGAECAADAYAAADDLLFTESTHIDRPLADFVLKVVFNASVGAGGFVRLYRRDMNIEVNEDAPVPAAGHERLFIGSFVIAEGGASLTKYYPLTDVKLIKQQQYYIENKTDQTLEAGWTLKVTAKTYGSVA